MTLNFFFFISLYPPFFRVPFFNVYQMEELIPIFVKIGLSEQKAKDTAKNKKLAPTLEAVINEAGVRESGCNKDTGILLYNLASTVTKDALPHLAFIVGKVMNGDLKTTDQIQGNNHHYI